MRLAIIIVIGFFLVTAVLYFTQPQSGQSATIQPQRAEPPSQSWQLYKSMISRIAPELKIFGLLLLSLLFVVALAVSMARVQVSSAAKEQRLRLPPGDSVVEQLMKQSDDCPEYQATLLDRINR